MPAEPKKMITFFKDHGGYARMKDLKTASFQTRDISRMVKENVIVKVKPGLYRLANVGRIVLPAIKGKGSGSVISQGMIDVCRAIPEGVICLASALAFYGLTTFNPSEIYVAIPGRCKKL
jgi:predicted transcriptional regulator of viral defense system